MIYARSQSAMEYLMTYGWAILIVAVVLAALFQLGIFSGVFSPRAQPGSCRVVRPLGPGTSAYASTQGVCTGVLPLYVAQFDGQSSYINAGNGASLSTPTYGVTIAAWIYAKSGSAYQGIATRNYRWPYGLMVYPDGKLTTCLTLSDGTPYYTEGDVVPLNQWVFVASVWNGNAGTIYQSQNGNWKQAGVTNSVSIASSANVLTIGSQYISATQPFNGLISNVQIYNSSLSANEVFALYKEGVGGAPILVQNLVGWWPLNGDTKDYSGNLNNGSPVNVVYTSSWTAGYALR